MTVTDSDALPDVQALTVTVTDVDGDLQVSITDTPDSVTSGSGPGNLTHTVTVTNVGLDNASGVALSEALALPAYTWIVSITPSGPTTYAPSHT